MSPIAMIACNFTSISTVPVCKIYLRIGIKVSDFVSIFSILSLARSVTRPQARRIENSSVKLKSNDMAVHKLVRICSKCGKMPAPTAANNPW